MYQPDRQMISLTLGIRYNADASLYFVPYAQFSFCCCACSLILCICSLILTS